MIRAHHTLMAIVVFVTAVTGIAIPATGQAKRFYADDPIWREPVTQNVTAATGYEPLYVYEYIRSYLAGSGEPAEAPRAQNVNTVDEIPDGPFFVNRAGRIPLTPELVARAANTDDGPGAGPWKVIVGGHGGVTPSFSIEDARGRRWYLKLDPTEWPGMASGAEIIGAKLFWALGFHTTEYHIVRFKRSDLVIAEHAHITRPGGRERRMRPEDLDRILELTHQYADGSYRAVASLAVPGRYVGNIRYEGTRKDDPNDLTPHEHHRELRAYSVFAAWLNHVDVSRTQSVESVVTENGRTFIRHYLLDWGSILGSAATRPREFWQGYEQLAERPLVIAERAVTFGLIVPEWRRTSFYEAPPVGRLPRDESAWDPESWQPMVSNGAFRNARADDKFWAAYKMTFLTEDIIRAVVAEAQLGDSVAAEHIIRTIMERRARILSTYLAAVNPIVEPVLGADGLLEFRNAAVEFAGAFPPRGYRATWYAFDNETGTTTLIGTSESTGTVVAAPTSLTTPFVKVEVSSVGTQHASWEIPISLYFRHHDGGWELVGLERM